MKVIVSGAGVAGLALAHWLGRIGAASTASSPTTCASRHASEEQGSYNVLQRLAYGIVVFFLGPLVLLSGLAFSPALASVMPALVGVFGGQQSARTIHFFAGLAVVLFLVGHILMVWLAGFWTRVKTMITGYPAAPEPS